MKILIVNNRYFISGGPERYLFSLKKCLERKGHTIIPFSVNYKNNEYSQYQKYFVNSPGDNSKVYFKELRLSLVSKVKFFFNTIFNFEAFLKIKRIISEHDPDIVYILQIVNIISPSVIWASKKLGKPIIMRLSDFGLICPSYLFIRNGKICEDCKKGLFNCVKNKCLQESYLVSFTRVLSMWVHRIFKTYSKVDYFVAPSLFLKNKMVEYGFKEDKIKHIPSFVAKKEIINDRLKNTGSENIKYKDYILYFGRVSKEKGIDVLIKAFRLFKAKPNIDKDIKLLIVGRNIGGINYEIEENNLDYKLGNIIFIDFVERNILVKYIRKSLFVVVPSIWYENNPLSIYEAMQEGKIVLASDIGSIREQIKDGCNGFLFDVGDIDMLSEKMYYIYKNIKELEHVGLKAMNDVRNKNNFKNHYKKLVFLFRAAIKDNKI